MEHLLTATCAPSKVQGRRPGEAASAALARALRLVWLRTFARRLLPWLLLATAAAAAAQDAPEISASAALQDLRLLQRSLADLHPGLYRHATPAQMDAEFAAAETAVQQGSSRAEMFLLASRLAAAVRCGHTWANRYNQSPEVQNSVLGRSDKLPLTLRWVQGRALVTGSMAPGAPAGAELLAIDGRPVDHIASALLPYLRADGQHAGADAKRRAQLDSGGNGGAMDRLFPLRFPPQAGRYRLRLRDTADAPPRELDVAAVTLAARDQALPAEAAQWTFQVAGDTALLTLPTFGFWRSDFKPEAYLARTFGALRGVPYLVIDLRRNEGGDDSIGRLLLSYLLRAPTDLPGYRVESAYAHVPDARERHLSTWDFSFFDRRSQARRGPGRNWLLPDRPGLHMAPNALAYAGRTIVLVGPQNSSATFLLARALQQTGVATLLGQPTGGNQRGLNAGQLAWVTLPASGVAVDIPLLASFFPGDPPDAGVLPEVAVAPSFADAQAGIDTELRAAQEHIARWRAAGIR